MCVIKIEGIHRERLSHRIVELVMETVASGSSTGVQRLQGGYEARLNSTLLEGVLSKSLRKHVLRLTKTSLG